MKVLAISGSLRRGSFNTFAVLAAQKLAPAGMEITLGDISEIPLYNEDVKAAGLPLAVATLANQIKAADAVLISTPEYNFSIPGGLKNALDWISRTPEQPLDGKPVAIMGASPGQVGTARVQYHLRQVLTCLNANVLNRPEVFIAFCSNKFDSEGALNDEPTAKVITALLTALAAKVGA